MTDLSRRAERADDADVDTMREREPEPHAGESIESIRARLAARGLLVSGPAVVIPTDRPPRPVLIDSVLAETDGDVHPNAVPEDDWDVASDGARSVPVRCPQCRGTQRSPLDVTRFRCLVCERAWRWAVCEHCDEVGFVVERQESWRCGECGKQTRSWWRTPTAPRDAVVVVHRRLDLAVRRERELVRAGMRKRRWKLVAGAVFASLLCAVFVGSVRAGDRGPVTGTAETCRQFASLRQALGSGTVDAAELRERLDALVVASQGADPAVADAAGELVAVGRPSRAAFLVAQTNLADACTAATR